MSKEQKGYVFEENNKFYARVTYTDKNGKRRNVKRTAKTKSEAEKILKKLIRQLDDEGEKGIQSEKITFGQICDYYEKHYLTEPEYFNEQKISGLRDCKRRKAMVKVFRLALGNRKVRDITYGDLMSFRRERLQAKTKAGKQRTVTTVNRELAALRRIFNIALREGFILKNPFNCGESLINTSAERKRERILTFEEEQRLLAACDERTKTYSRYGKEIISIDDLERRKHLKPFLIALLDTGGRKGEMLKLTWRDVDFDRRLITFQALNTKTLKTRRVAITQRFYDELQALWQNSNVDLDALVFGIKDNVRRSFSTALNIAGIKEGGIDGISLHSLRHTFATRLVKGQISIQIAARILGHSQITTSYRYISANDESLYDAASVLESIQQQQRTQISELIS